MSEIEKKSHSFLQKMLAKKWLVGIGVIVLIGLIYLAKQTIFKSSTQPQYQTAQVERTTLISSITGSGQVASTNSTSITTAASGVISKVFVQEGQTVKAGAPIAKIDLDLTSKQKAQQALASYQSARNSLAAAQSQMYNLQSTMFVNNQKFMNGAIAGGLATSDPVYIEQNATWLASEADYKNQQAVLNQAQTSVSQAWLNYQQLSDTIYAPISGKVTGLSLQTGAVISPASAGSSGTTSTTSTKLANIITDAKPIIKVNLTEIDVPKVQVGNKATVTFDALGTDKTFVGKIVSIDTVGQVSSGVTTYPAIIQLDDMNNSILSNMAATANIITNTKTDVLAVPNSVIQTQNGQTTARVLRNGQLQNVPVTTGLVTDTQTEITSGLKEGDTVVTSVIQPNAARSATTTTSPFSAFGGGRGFGGGGGGGATRGGAGAGR